MASDSVKQIDSITKFESMSDDLIMELFEYYDLYSLYYSFGLLNSRIDHIIYHCQICVNFDQVKRDEFVDFIRDILPKFNPENIRSLHASNLYQIGVLAFDKSLIYFTHIRSLSLYNIETTVINDIFSRIHFSRLERFVLKHNANQMIHSAILNQFLDFNRFRFLRTYRDSYTVLQNVTSVILFEYVSFSNASHPNNFLNFLNQSPYLKSIKARLKFDLNYSESIYLPPIFYHNTLRHLNLQLAFEVCTQTVVHLFECVPQLRYLKLNIDSWIDPQLTNPIFWETVLSKHIVKLQRLWLDSKVKDLISSTTDHIWNFLMDQDKVNEQIQISNYWSSHQWNVTFNSIALINQFGSPRRQARFQVN